MTQGISYFIPSSLVETYKYIEVSDWYFVTEKQRVEVPIKVRDDNGKPFVDTLYNVRLAKDLFNQLFYIITLINSGRTCLFHKGF